MTFEFQTATVLDLVRDGLLWVEDGNHGENRPLAHEFNNTGTPFIRPDNLSRGAVCFEECDRINEVALERVRKGKGRAGDIAFTHRATVGRIARVSDDAPNFVANPGVTIWRSLDSARIDRNYLYYFMQTPFFMDQVWAEAGNTDTFPYISLTQQRRLLIRFPEINLQRATGNILGDLDDRITLLSETNSTLEAIANTLYKSWFVNFDPVRAKSKGRDPEGMDGAMAAVFPDSFEESALGLVPKGWRYRKLSEVCSYLNRGLSPKYVEKDGVLVINQKCIRDFSVDYTKARRHDPLQRKIDGRSLVIGDVLVNSTGVGTLGRVAQVLALTETTIVDSHVTVVRAGAELSWPFLGQWMNRKQPDIELMGEGSTGQTELSRSKLGDLLILVPGQEVLHAFDDCVNAIKKRMAVNEEKAITLATFRDTLLPRLISGQLHLHGLEKVNA